MALFHHLRHRGARVLFVCLGNSYRSRMAEAFANAYGSDVIEARSAGFAAARRLSRTAGRLMLEKGITLPDTLPRNFSPSELDGFDLVVNLCEFGLPKTAARVVKVVLPDPVGKQEEEQRAIRNDIERLVKTLILQFRQAREWELPAPVSVPRVMNRPLPCPWAQAGSFLRRSFERPSA